MPVTLPPSITDFIEELAGLQPSAIWLAGSYARGDFARFSDVDLGVISNDPPRAMERHSLDGLLVSVSFTSEGRTLASFRDPGAVGGAIPGWRYAELLHDPARVGARLQQQALVWDWSLLEPVLNPWLRHAAKSSVELLHKMLNALERAAPLEASRQKQALADHLIRLMGVHTRLLYDSESRLIEAVNLSMGKDWARLIESAIGPHSGSFADSVRAATLLFEQAASRVDAAMDDGSRGLLLLGLDSISKSPHILK